MTNTAAAVLARAATQIGIGETPPRSNRNKFTDWYGIGPAQWCDIFVSWVGNQSGAADIIGRFAYTPSHANWFKKAGRWHTKAPRAGDVVFFDFGLGRISHVGFVEKVLSNGTLQTIEGNTDVSGSRTGGKVMRKHRPLTHVVGYGRPNYQPRIVPKRTQLQKFQSLMGLAPDDKWGPKTQEWSDRMRAAALIWTGGKASRPLNIAKVQKVVGAAADGQWGPKSQKALEAWVRKVQQAFGLTADGQWGPKTETAFWALRRKALS